MVERRGGVWLVQIPFLRRPVGGTVPERGSRATARRLLSSGHHLEKVRDAVTMPHQQHDATITSDTR
jgi:hypothetical protein